MPGAARLRTGGGPRLKPWEGDGWEGLAGLTGAAMKEDDSTCAEDETRLGRPLLLI